MKETSSFDAERERMVKSQLEARGIADENVLRSMKDVPREVFVPRELRYQAYEDRPLPIGTEQTISQPFIVAAMIQALQLTPTDKALEVGAGSGYAAAVMSRIAGAVYAIERHENLVRQARERIERLGYDNLEIRHGDGTLGWPEEAPFDAIVVAAAATRVPPSLREQLTVGGRLVIPVGSGFFDQRLVRITRTSEKGFEERELEAVRFVPLVGKEA